MGETASCTGQIFLYVNLVAEIEFHCGKTPRVSSSFSNFLGVVIIDLSIFYYREGKRQQVKYIGDFFDKFYVPNSGQSSIVALDWSTVHPELLLASYQSREGSTGLAAVDANGSIESSCCCLWNLKHRQTAPEYTFTYQVDITAAILTEFHPSTVIGGTKGGQIILWDIRFVLILSLCTSFHQTVPCVVDVAKSLINVTLEGEINSWALLFGLYLLRVMSKAFLSLEGSVYKFRVYASGFLL